MAQSMYQMKKIGDCNFSELFLVIGKMEKSRTGECFVARPCLELGWNRGCVDGDDEMLRKRRR